MFTLQISQAANQLRQAGMSSEVVDVLMNMLGNCQQTLVHRAPITVSSDMPLASFPVSDTPSGDYPPAAILGRSDGEYNPNTGRIEGGFAGRFDGPVYIKGPIFGPGASPIKLAIASSNWKKSLPQVSLVDAQEVLSLGGLQTTGPTFSLYLPHTTPGDPNVTAGMVLAYGVHNGVAVSTSPYMDDKIGTVKLWALSSGEIPDGWKKMDGTDNASNGSGYDMQGKFAKGAGNVGQTGGSTNYTPSGIVDGSISGTFNTSSETVTYSGTTDPYTWTGTTTVNATLDLSTLESDEFTIDRHFDHFHYVSYSRLIVVPDAGGVEVVAFPLVGDTFGAGTAPTTNVNDSTPGDDARAHPPTRALFTESSAYPATFDIDMSAWDHAHTYAGVTDSHSHTVDIDASGFTFTGDSATIEPPYLELFYIERVDNSD